MKKSEILKEAKRYLVPVYVEDFTCYICNAVLLLFGDGQYSRVNFDEVIAFIQSTLDETPWVAPGVSIKVQTLDMSDKERYELRLMFMDFLILMYEDEERSA